MNTISPPNDKEFDKAKFKAICQDQSNPQAGNTIRDFGKVGNIQRIVKKIFTRTFGSNNLFMLISPGKFPAPLGRNTGSGLSPGFNTGLLVKKYFLMGIKC